MVERNFVQFQFEEVKYVSTLSINMSNNNEEAHNQTLSTHSQAIRKDPMTNNDIFQPPPWIII